MNTMSTNMDDSSAKQEFERLYRESYALVYSFVRTRVNDDATAEDIVAESFFKAARAFDRFDPTRAKFSTWVVTIAHNCMVSHFRKQRPTVRLENAPEPTAPDSLYLGSIEDRDLALRLLSVLSEDERNLVLLKYQDGKRNVQIAAELGINPSTVATNLSRALNKMRSHAERNQLSN